MTEFGTLLLALAAFGLALLIGQAVLYVLLGSEKQRDARHRADLGDKWWHEI